MKKYFIYTVYIIFLQLCLYSCSKDLGNYDYQDINELTEIGGIEASYNALTGQPIQIIPELKFTKDPTVTEDNYLYEWLSLDDAISIEVGRRRLISTSRNLDTILNLPASNYTFYYRVTEKSTGIQWRKSFKVHITTDIRNGWLVLNDINGTARLDMLNYLEDESNFYHYNDILSSTASGIELKSKPVSVAYVYNRDLFTSAFTDRIYVSTDSGTHSINNQVFTWSNHRKLDLEVMRPLPEDYHAKKVLPTGSSALTYLHDSEGVIGVENLTQALMYGPTLNRLNTGGMIEVSPHLAVHYRINSNYIVMFDPAARRFLVHSGTSQVSFVPSSSDTDIFNPADVGKDLRYFEFTPSLNGHYFAVLKDTNSDKHYVLRFARASTSVFTPLSYEEITDAPDIAQATSFAVDPVSAYLFYQSGSKVYQHDPFSKTTKLVLDLGTRNISLMKYYRTARYHTTPRYMEYASKLLVCSYEDINPSTSGKMELYNVPSGNQNLTLYQSFDGFGKIVDVSYRE